MTQTFYYFFIYYLKYLYVSKEFIGVLEKALIFFIFFLYYIYQVYPSINLYTQSTENFRELF